VLKICDFGFATVYRNIYDEKAERVFLKDPIGTSEYGAPEVFNRHYLFAI
jgi:serine/threonine protein kinase